MIHAKLFAAALAALILVVSLCSCEIGTEPTETTEATTEATTATTATEATEAAVTTAPEATEEPISVPTMPDDDTIRARYVRPNERPDGTYGINRFSITLCNDGTCRYYETMISSHIGVGKYTIDGDLLTITDENIRTVYGDIIKKIYKFKIVGDTLVFIADGSDSFTFIKLPDGAVFEKE